MEIKVIFDKAAVDKKIKTGWGFSVLVDDKILFDTGEKGEWLIDNLKQMNIAAGKIEGVVISHNHWYHTGGLWSLLETAKKSLPVYGCPGFPEEFRKNVSASGGMPVKSGKFAEISKNIFVTGEIPGNYKGDPMPEQALILKTENGISVITGCAHPGILKILDEIKKKFKKERLFLVMGGFHLLDEDKRVLDFIVSEFKDAGVEKAGPTHCSGPKAEAAFAAEYGENFIHVRAGMTIEI